ncbi:MAG: MFS transporter [Oceanospirillaceae bacterium]|nr:MFS transporter [Oceanospirillaceae bacterium]MBT10475.1 MFS transporter [Oceanospirillaceae bacterium]|tara:strand:- start:49025 stop:50218 length:1194 start_codon:yes stop_codon:yes gene_type:complete
MPLLIRGLMVAQALALSAAPLMVLLGGLIGRQLHPDPRFATLPVAAMICGAAVFAWPAAQLARYLGRRRLFVVAMLCGALFSLLASVSVSRAWFWGFTLSAFGIGAVGVVVQQFRFVAMASVSADQAPVVAARLLLAGLVSAFLGPELTRLNDWLPSLGGGAAFAALIICYLAAAGILLWLMPRSGQMDSRHHHEGRRWSELLSQPALPLAMVSAACGYGVMAYIMTATPLSMTQGAGYDLSAAKWVIQSHIVAMFLPSLISGQLIRRLGHWRMIFTGMLIMLLCILIAWWDQTFVHYWLGLVLLGLGWNLLFVAGTALLSRCYQTEEAGRVEGINDLAVFACQALGALASGAVVLVLGWQGMLLTTLPALLLLLMMLLRTPRRGVSGGGLASVRES